MATGLSNASGLSATSSSLILQGRYGGLSYATNAPPQTETTSWQDAVVTNGGTVSGARYTIVNNFIAAEKAAGTWALTDDYWPLWAENAPQALTSLKQRRLATVTAAPVFTVDRGYAFNGTTNYVNTGFVPSTHAVAMTGTNTRLAVYERTNVVGAVPSLGAANSGTQALHMIAHTATGFASSRLNTDGVSLLAYTLTPATSIGYTAASRNGSSNATSFAYKNGVALVQAAGTPTYGSVHVTFAIYIGCWNTSGTAASFRANSVGFACTGASLTPAQELAQYNNVQTWALAVGAMSDDADAQSWADQVVTNGGTVSGARLKIVTDFIKAEKAAGTWALMDDYWAFFAENALQSLTSLKQRRLATAVNAPTFIVGLCWQFSGTNNYIDTGHIPSTHSTAMTGTNMRYAVQERTNVGSAMTFGSFNSATQAVVHVGRSSTNLTVQLNHSGLNMPLAPFNISTGYTAVSRAGGGTTVNAYRNGTPLGVPVTSGVVGTALPTASIYVGCRNNAGVADTFGTRSIGFLCVGAPLSEAQELAHFNNMQTWATAIGANV